MSQTSESKPAGMFRGKDIVPKEKGVYLILVEKLKSDPHPEYGDDRFSNGFWDGEKWQVYFTFHEWLDESPEAIAEARQTAFWEEREQTLVNVVAGKIKEIDRLTADLDIAKRRIIALEAIDKECESRISAVTKQRDRFIEIARDMQEQSNNWCEIQVGDLLDYLESIEGEKT